MHGLTQAPRDHAMICATCGGRIYGTDVAGFWVWLHYTRPEVGHFPAPQRITRGPQ